MFLRKLSILSILLISIIVLPSHAQDDSVFENYITVSGDRLMDGNDAYRFISFNVPNLHCIEDNMIFEETNAWRLPDKFEIEDALKSIKMIGGEAVRIYTLTVRRPDDTPDIPRYVTGPGQFNEDAFVALDQLLASANEIGVRIIIPFVDNWSWMGGIADYAHFRDKKAKEFWTDEQLKEDFKKTLEFVINRTNTISGIKYKNDKAILAWETGNELKDVPEEWTREMATYIKQLDKNHLLIDGYHSNTLRDAALENPYIDIVTTHHYESNPMDMQRNILNSAQKAKGVKPYLVGEFGWLYPSALIALLDEIIEKPTICGALIWSLRFHNRDGGFYRHSEPAIGGLFKAYHFPGFLSGHPNAEKETFEVMRNMAFKIRGLPVPPIPAPEPPVMLPTTAVSSLVWQGSAGASGYDIERSTAVEGPWTTVAHGVSDAAVAYRPLFNDVSAKLGKSYYYRTRAVNESGRSEPSNVIGPITVNHSMHLDEVSNYGKMYSHKGEFIYRTDKARKTKEDLNRIQGEKGSELVYFVPGDMLEFRIYSFSEKEEQTLEILTSPDGINYNEADYDFVNYFIGALDYGYLVPILYKSNSLPKSTRFIKIKFLYRTQVGRVEIDYR